MLEDKQETENIALETNISIRKWFILRFDLYFSDFFGTWSELVTCSFLALGVWSQYWLSTQIK